jgi:hypothetical protein
MAKPTRVTVLHVLLHDDTVDTYHGVGFYPHSRGLDVVDAAGGYVHRYGPDDFLSYTGDLVPPTRALEAA